MHALDPVFSPRTVAVVGASRSRDSIGWSIVHNMIEAQFTGAIYPVNPKAAAIHSLKCYPSLGAIPDRIDLAVVTVPRALVQGVVEEAIALGVRAFVVITAGYGETGEEGRALEAQLRATIRAAGARMVGPNCMGVINTDAAVSLNATFSPTPAVAGSVGFVSQSGALGVAILNVAAQLGIGLTQFVSMGNKADVSGNDLVEYWENDPATKVMCMYLESFGNPRRFTEIAKRVTRKKPILIVKSGRTAEGARAASSHTGAMAGTDVTVSAFLDQCGVLRADTIGELFDVARALDRCPLPAGSRVAIVTNAGGPGIMATDACVNLELEMAELSDATRAHLASFLPSAASLGNPVDMIASATAEQYERTVAAVLADPGVDAALVVNVTPLLGDPRDVLEAVGRAARAATPEPGDGTAEPAVCGKPVLAVMMAVEAFYEGLKSAHHLPPVYRFPESAALALAQLVRYGEWRRRPEHEALPDFDFDRDDDRRRRSPARATTATSPPTTPSACSRRWASRSPAGRSRPTAPKRSPPRGGSATRWWSRRSPPASSTRARRRPSSSTSRARPRSAAPATRSRTASRQPASRSPASSSRRWPRAGTRRSSASPPTPVSARC